MSNNTIGSGVGFFDPLLLKQKNEVVNANQLNTTNSQNKQSKKLQHEIKLEERCKIKRNKIYK